jgi:hypothetical protein
VIESLPPSPAAVDAHIYRAAQSVYPKAARRDRRVGVMNGLFGYGADRPKAVRQLGKFPAEKLSFRASVEGLLPLHMTSANMARDRPRD